MADIAFLLLIFFMVSTVFVRYRVTGIVLPRAEKSVIARGLPESPTRPAGDYRTNLVDPARCAITPR